MKKVLTSFGKFAEQWDKEVGDRGNFTHVHMVNKSLFKLVGNVRGKYVYDVACGNGLIARELARKGAGKVWASDISSELIDLAQSEYPKLGINYSVRDAGDFSNIPIHYFDKVILNLAAYYIQGIPGFLKGVRRILKKDGMFILVLAHPLFNVAEELENSKVKAALLDKNYLQQTVVSWYKNGQRKFGKNVYFHRPLGFYLNALLQAGFQLVQIEEPEGEIKVHGKVKTVKIPKYILIKAVKA